MSFFLIAFGFIYLFFISLKNKWLLLLELWSSDNTAELMWNLLVLSYIVVNHKMAWAPLMTYFMLEELNMLSTGNLSGIADGIHFGGHYNCI